MKPRYDFTDQFRTLAVVAKYFNGAASFEFLESKTFDEVWFYYKLYEFQATWDEIVNELSYDKKGNSKKLPSNKKIKEIVEARIKKASGK